MNLRTRRILRLRFTHARSLLNTALESTEAAYRQTREITGEHGNTFQLQLHIAVEALQVAHALANSHVERLTHGDATAGYARNPTLSCGGPQPEDSA